MRSSLSQELSLSVVGHAVGDAGQATQEAEHELTHELTVVPPPQSIELDADLTS